MARRLLTKYPRSIYKGTKEIKQPFKYLLVLDLECTCKKYEKIQPQEIIELPCVALSTKHWEIENVFHEYIKPRFHPNLTTFCTSLTGITQGMVDEQPHFPEVFEKFSKWLTENDYVNKDDSSAFVTCGDWDLKYMLPQQCQLDKIPLPKYFLKWINLKGSFCDATQLYPRTLVDMMSHLDFSPEGKLHSGIDDVQNMVRIIKALHTQHNFEFKINNMYISNMEKFIKYGSN